MNVSETAAGEPSSQRAAPTADAGPRPADWYKDAVIYQLHVRSFFDSNGDGIGDFAGLTEKLEYVAALGVTAVWLLPFYPSPLRDEGYDIADYRTVNPVYGTLDDFRKFLDAAHRLGLSVITELVINHTSDQHPWFQRARRAPRGSSEREFYVWSDASDRYPEVRVIFQDFENSNWAWDPVAQQYFWHRFYSHQPDLNFDHPEVRRAVFELVDFWFEAGVDGLRLDAVPYLFERDGTNCESLPETHAFLRDLRRHVDERFPGRLLLAEANQWPEETAAYFGADDECHMCFNFPLMPRLFMAVQQEERFPIVDVLRHTPEPPPSAQWAIFLRNHDELTLEMVTDEERDAMYRFYAGEPQSRINLGLRRRLAPLLRNDRRKLELMHALLFSLPGTPVMYYGDEIRMGDNIYLRDRDSVRTPMQWNADRNAGFSRTNTQRLFLPTIVDPEFHHQSTNVETEEQNPNSFLWWLRRLVRLRGRHPSFCRGELEFLFPQNPRILAFLRKYDEEIVLTVVNLSRLTQFVELDLASFRGRIPVELFGRTRFPMIGDLPYLLTLGPYGFYWFRLEWPKGEESRREPDDLPLVRVAGDWQAAFRRPALERTCDALAAYLVNQVWYHSSDRTLRAVELRELAPSVAVDDDGTTYAVAIVRAHFTDGEPELYQVTPAGFDQRRAQAVLHDRPTAGALRVDSAEGSHVRFLCDAAGEASFWRHVAIEPLASGNPAVEIGTSRIVFRSFGLDAPTSPTSSFSVTTMQRTNGVGGTVVSFDQRLFAKLFRRVEPGLHPEVEVAAALAPLDSLPLPRLRGTWSLESRGNTTTLLGAIFDYVPHERTLADRCRAELARVVERAVTAPADSSDESSATRSATAAHDASAAASRIFRRLGRRLGEVHAALADIDDRPAFVPEVFTSHYRRSLHFGFRAQVQRTFEMLRAYVRRTGEASRLARASELQAAGRSLERRFEPLLQSRALLWRIRCHGALGLDSILLQGDDLVIVDWGGDPTRPFSERRIKRSALDDLARFVTAFHHAVDDQTRKLMRQMPASPDGGAKLRSATEAWRRRSTAEFLGEYRAAVSGKLLVPEEDDEFQDLFEAFRVDAAVEHLAEALRLRPVDTVEHAIDACLELVAAPMETSR